MGKTETKSLNILLAMTIAIALAICFVSVQNVYADEPVASITKEDGSATTYVSLQAACEAAENGDTIVLIGDETVEEGESIEIGFKSITIDLAGHTYTDKNALSSHSTVVLGREGIVTFTDSSADGSGTMIAVKKLIDVRKTSQLTIEGGNFKCLDKSHNSSFAVIFNSGTTTIKGGTIINEGENNAIYNNENWSMNGNDPAKLIMEGGVVQANKFRAIENRGDAEINGGKIISEAPNPEGSGTYYALYCPGGCSAEINGDAEITATNSSIGALGVYGSEVKINGGNFGSFVGVGDNAKMTVKGGTFTNNWEILGEPNVEIEGGTFEGELCSYAWSEEQCPTIKIKGGEFKNKILVSTYGLLTIEGGKFSGESIKSGYASVIKISGGYFMYDNVRSYIEEGCKFIDNVDEPELLADGYRYTVRSGSYCTVNYDTHGGTAIRSTGANKGLPMPIPAVDPQKDNRTFDGWFYDSELTKPVQAGDTIEEDVTLHAAWKGSLHIGVKDPSDGGAFKLTVGTEDKGEISKFEGDVREGTTIKVEAKPNPGYKCEKWVNGDSYETITKDAVYEFTFADTGKYFVYFKPVLVEKIRFRTLKSSVAEDGTLQLELTILPANATNQSVIWRSSDETVLTVNGSGKVTGVREGRAVITVIAKDGSGVSVSRRITVTHTHAQPLTPVEEVQPTCTEEGKQEYWVCSTCGKWFSDPNGKYETSEEALRIPAVGHDWGEWTVKKDATETEEGLQVRTCTNDPSHEDSVAIPKKDHVHVISPVKGKDAMCTESGLRDHYQCDVCKALFEDEAGEVLTSENSIKIPATGHTAREPEKGEETPATCCSVGGHNLITRCGTCGKVLTVERVVIPFDEDAHAWGEWVVEKEATVDEEGLEERVCRNDTSHVEMRTIPKLDPANNIAKAKAGLSAAAFTYNGKVQKPAVTVKLNGATLKANTDYTVAYASGRKNVGQYTVTVKGKGQYFGSKVVTFKINPKGTSLKKPAGAKKAITVKWAKQSAKMATSRITGYQILLATNSKFTKNKKTVNVKGYQKVSKKVTKLKGGKKYYIKIRTYTTVKGKKYYSKWSKVKTIKTKK